MQVVIKGKKQNVSPRRLLAAAGIVSVGLLVALLALTHDAGPREFFSLAPAIEKTVAALGYGKAETQLAADEKVERRRPRDFVVAEKPWEGFNADYEIKDGKLTKNADKSHPKSNMWASWYYTIPSILLALIAAAIALLMARKFHFEMKAAEPGNPRMVEIKEAVREGAMAYLRSQRKVVLPVLGATAVVIALINIIGMPWWLCIFVLLGLLTGGISSFATGWYGMNTATEANSRTAWACNKGGLNSGLQVAFRAGAVMGLMVVGIGLAFVTVWLLVLSIFDSFIGSVTLNEIANAMITFGLGASLVALFARVGGGIYTKAADVGADLVGKVEAGIPEDDPRNPATIADNVGDNVGDVAGMGADLYESYVGSILATIALAWSAGQALGQNPWGFVAAPLLIAAGGILLSVFGTRFVKTQDGATLNQLLKALKAGVHVASICVVPLSLVVCILCFGWGMGIGMWLATCIGLGAGLVIAWGSEKYTSYDDKPTQDVSRQALTGPATVIIGGLAVGMMSTWIPIITVAVATLLAFGLGGGFAAPAAGVYAVSLAAVGMLSTLGITLATDAYGPIADNAGGNAEMAGLPPEVREKTDALDSLGNTTAAIGKGFAIGSAALTALALIAAYWDSAKGLANTMNIEPDFSLAIISPQVIIGLFIGALLVMVFCALTMKAVGDAAKEMVEEVRRQFREIPGIMEGTGKPDYANCVSISTKAAIKRMMVPAIIAVAGPILTGVLFGGGAVFGLLAGGLASGFAMAVMMANAGGSWDNAKKFIEKGGLAELLIADGSYVPERDDPKPVTTSGGGSDDGKTKHKKKKKKDGGDSSSESGGEEAAESGSHEAAESGKSEAAPADAAKAEESRSAAETPKAEEPKAADAPKAEEPKAAEAPKIEAPVHAEPKKKKYARYMKGSPEHKAAVTGDTVGDPFKDTSGPSLNILVKLMSMVAVATIALVLAVNKGGGVLSWLFEAIYTTTGK